MSEKFLQESCTQTALTDFSPENGTILFLAERLRIINEHKMTQLIQFQYH